MKTIGKFTKTAVAIAITGALVVPASTAFAGEKTDRAVVGALIGGIAGAALGHGKGDAVAIGAVAGAALGRHDRQQQRPPLQPVVPDRPPLRLRQPLQQQQSLQP
jgi:hypothetical protein